MNFLKQIKVKWFHWLISRHHRKKWEFQRDFTYERSLSNALHKRKDISSKMGFYRVIRNQKYLSSNFEQLGVETSTFRHVANTILLRCARSKYFSFNNKPNTYFNYSHLLSLLNISGNLFIFECYFLLLMHITNTHIGDKKYFG